jgi:hypothetical protein
MWLATDQLINYYHQPSLLGAALLGRVHTKRLL